MMHLLELLPRGCASLVIVAAALLAFILTRTRFASWSVFASPLLIWLCTGLGQFDERRFFASTSNYPHFIWISCVDLRAVGGLVLLFLAAPIGAAAGKSLRVHRGAFWGLATLGPFATSLVMSSALLLSSVLEILAMPDDSGPEKLQVLRTAVSHSDRIIAAGTFLSVLVCGAVATRLLHRQTRSSNGVESAV